MSAGVVNVPEMPSADVLEEAPPPYQHDLAVSTLFLTLFVGFAALATPHAQPTRLPGGALGLAMFAAMIFGLTIIVVISSLSYPIRRLLGEIPILGPHLYKPVEPEPEGLLACPLCTGTWLGAILSVLGFNVFTIFDPIDVIAHGLLGAGIVWLLYGVTHKLDIN